MNRQKQKKADAAKWRKEDVKDRKLRARFPFEHWGRRLPFVAGTSNHKQRRVRLHWNLVRLIWLSEKVWYGTHYVTKRIECAKKDWYRKRLFKKARKWEKARRCGK